MTAGRSDEQMQQNNNRANGQQVPRNFYAVLQQRFGECAEVLRRALPQVDTAVITGSGMGSLLQETARPVLSYEELPGFPQPTVAGHTGVVRHAGVEGASLLLFTGRMHLYEGVAVQDVVAPVALAALIGIRRILLLNSAGGLQPGWRTGDIMLIADTINMTFRSGRRGWMYKVPRSYLHHPVLFDEQWRRSTGSELTHAGIPFREGTYLGVTGPGYETPAEVRCFRRLGGQAIGMSTIHEAEFARMCGMAVAGCSLISNTLHETAAPALSHAEVLAAAHAGQSAVEEWIRACCRSRKV